MRISKANNECEQLKMRECINNDDALCRQRVYKGIKGMKLNQGGGLRFVFVSPTIAIS